MDDFDIDAELGAVFDDRVAVGAVGPGLGDGWVSGGDGGQQLQ
ncbi:hypothetical protein [Streptosporangium canum]